MPKFSFLIFLLALFFIKESLSQTVGQNVSIIKNDAKELFTIEHKLVDSAFNLVAEFKQRKFDISLALKWLNEHAVGRMCSEENELKIDENIQKLRQNLCGQLKSGKSFAKAAETVVKTMSNVHIVLPTIDINAQQKIQQQISWLNAKNKMHIGTLVDHFNATIGTFYSMIATNKWPFVHPKIVDSKGSNAAIDSNTTTTTTTIISRGMRRRRRSDHHHNNDSAMMFSWNSSSSSGDTSCCGFVFSAVLLVLIFGGLALWAFLTHRMTDFIIWMVLFGVCVVLTGIGCTCLCNGVD